MHPSLSWSPTREIVMLTNRRTFLLAAGGAGLALAGAGGWFAVTRRPVRAQAAWDDVKTAAADVRLDAFRHAILAPNAHNRQPWQVRLVGLDEAIIGCDLARRLPHTDPFDRQTVIGFGCFLELARMAAAQRGVRVDMQLFPAGEPVRRLTDAPVARLRFVADEAVAKDPLFSAITLRRSSKVPFDMTRAVEAPAIAALLQASGAAGNAFASVEAAVVADLRALTWRACSIEAGTARTHQESVDLMRIGRAEIEADPDGIALGGVVIEALARAGQLSRAQLADPASRAFKAGVDRYRTMLELTPGYLWITSPGNSRADQIAAGRAYVRANLAVAASGFCMHPVSQALQEYPEMAGEFAALHQRLAVAAPGRIQMLARLGFGPAVEPAARWPLRSRLMA
jgi:hypothetical protein